jgi:hypothetical protein
MRQYGLVKARDAINRRLYKGFDYCKDGDLLLLCDFHRKTLSELYWEMREITNNNCLVTPLSPLSPTCPTPYFSLPY